MLIRFFDNLQNLAEEELVLELKEPLPLRELLKLLAMKYPGLARYAEKEPTADPPPYIVFTRDTRPLRFHELVSDKDVLFAYVPAAGG